MNWKKIVKEIPEKEQLKLLEKRRKDWLPLQSKTGFIETWRKIFTYKGIKFQLAILRHFSLNKGFTPMSNRKSDRHVVVEYLKSTKHLVEFIENLDGDFEFLWHDTLHYWNEQQTLEEQLEEAYNLAKEDINNLPKWFDKKEKELRNKIKKLKEFRKKLGMKSKK